MSDVTINVTVSQGGTIDADLEGATVINTTVEDGGQIAAEVIGGGTGPQGATGATGPEGPEGPPGPQGGGVPDGGTTAQVLRKASNTDQDTEWHSLVKADVGLSSVDNTSDVNKPISTATQAALDTKIDGIGVSGQLPYWFDDDTLGSLSTVTYPSMTELSYVKGVTSSIQTQVDGKQPLDTDLTTIAGLDSSTAGALATDGAGWIRKTYAQLKTALSLVKGDVGLGNVDNTSDANKPVSTLQAAADAAVQAASQPLDADLTTIAGLTPTTDNFMVATSSAWASRTPTQARSQMGLGSLAVLSAVAISNITATGTPSGSNFLRGDGVWATPSGAGDVAGPASSTDNAVARFDSTTGKVIQNSAVTIADTTGDITGGKYNTVAISGASTPTLAVTGTSSISGANTGDQTTVSGNAGSATVLQTARNIAGVSFNGSANISIPSTGLSDTANLVRVVKQQVFTADGTYTPSTGMLYCVVEAVGGGGAGGGAAGAASESRSASGGGSGSYARSILTAATIGASKAVDIGAGGTAGTAGDNAGNNGADTTLGTTLVVAKGGSGGAARGVGTAGGAGGVAGTGDATVVGQKGFPGTFNGGSTLFAIHGGAGGSSFFGPGGTSAAHITTSAGTAGVKGGGGAGGSAYNTASTTAGSAGGDGYMIITEFCSQ